MVYTSCSLSLAALEVFVHLEVRTEPDDLVSVMAELPVDEEDLLRDVSVLLAGLPKDWRRLENQRLKEVGAQWIGSGRSLAMMVPSAVIEGEWDALVNPQHPGARLIRVGEQRPFRFDPRMFR